MTAGQRLSAACATIDTIPEQLDDVLQHKADNLAMNLEMKLAAVRKMINHSSTGGTTCADDTLKRLKEIPDIILSSFEEKIVKVKTTVRQRVNGMIHDLMNSDIQADQISGILWTIPEEVQQIAGAAVEEAVEESKEQATQQLNMALQTLPKDAQENCWAISSVKQEIMTEVPGVYPESVRAARTAAAVSVKHAIAAVDTDAGAVPNKLVVDILFRAKTGQLFLLDAAGRGTSWHTSWRTTSRPTSRGSPRSSEVVEGPQVPGGTRPTRLSSPDRIAPAASPQAAGNPGSTGHPELCSRPCLYFRLGRCTNGSACSFCHCAHSQRLAHLGRRHRKMLEGLDFPERLSILSPVLEAKLEALGIPAEALGPLRLAPHEGLGPARDAADGASPEGETRRHLRLKDARCLERALRALTLRSLLTVLLNPPDEGGRHVSFDAIVERLRSESQAAQWVGVPFSPASQRGEGGGQAPD